MSNDGRTQSLNDGSNDPSPHDRVHISARLPEQPQLTDLPEQWLAWMEANPHRALPGIGRVNSSFRLDDIRALLSVSQLAPSPGNATTPQGHYRFQGMMVHILRVPGRYQAIVQSHGIEIAATRSYTRYQSSSGSMTLEDVARHLADSSITFEEADSFLQYARTWVCHDPQAASMQPNDPPTRVTVHPGPAGPTINGVDDWSTSPIIGAPSGTPLTARATVEQSGLPYSGPDIPLAMAIGLAAVLPNSGTANPSSVATTPPRPDSPPVHLAGPHAFLDSETDD
jgi:hypothetical protein